MFCSLSCNQALTCHAVRIIMLQVSAPRVGEAHPASVLAEVVVDTRGMRGDVASGWDELKQHDVLFIMGGEAV